MYISIVTGETDFKIEKKIVVMYSSIRPKLGIVCPESSLCRILGLSLPGDRDLPRVLCLIL